MNCTSGVRRDRHRSVHSLFTHAVALRFGQTEKNMERFTNLRVILRPADIFWVCLFVLKTSLCRRFHTHLTSICLPHKIVHVITKSPIQKCL